jgi:hypothetical protein
MRVAIAFEQAWNEDRNPHVAIVESTYSTSDSVIIQDSQSNGRFAGGHVSYIPIILMLSQI